MTRLLCAAFFVSGASALIFELLWFHQAGLAFGSSVWASSLVLTGFMAGLASGNALAAHHGDRFGHPIHIYVLMELTIAVTGVGLIYLLPHSGSALSSLLAPWGDQPLVHNLIRLLLAFILLVIPSMAMGVTLPLLAKVLVSADTNFGSVLGRLYGWNTLGAVMGIALSEFYLIEHLGIRGTGLFAGGLNVVAAAVAMGLAGRHSYQPRPAPGIGPKAAKRSSGRRWLAAAFLSGFCLLALEVVWFRFLSLYVVTTTAAFALMLATVLAGIAAGGLAGSFWLSRREDACRHSASISLLAGALCALSFAGFSWVVKPYGHALDLQPLAQAWDILRVGVPLMFPVSFVSGVFFILIGASLRRELGSEMRTTGLLTMVNTIGAAAGSLAGGFVLLPTLGMERSFFIIAALYGSAGLLLLVRGSRPPPSTWYAAALLLILGLALFPFGAMTQRHLRIPAGLQVLHQIPAIAAIREGLTETITLLKMDWYGKTIAHKMITNSFSMSGTSFQARRYMKLYVYWPVAVHPRIRNALLISFGVGSTAKALTDTRGIETIDIVDISRDILEMNPIIVPDTADQPLRDPRVRVHVEDGRYFLQATRRRFDLITGEPPPPRTAGVVNLYTREYFELMRRRLTEGGMVTYWLPMHSVSEESAKSILKSFCQVFADCSLWHGSGADLMMVATRDAKGPVLEEFFVRQWSDPAVRDEMKALGFEKPEQLGALFIADADTLNDFLRDAPPLADDFPKRIMSPGSREGYRKLFLAWTDTSKAKERFIRSPLIERLWPGPMRTASLPYFDIQDSLNAYLNDRKASLDLNIPHLHRLLTKTRLTMPVAWFLGSDADQLGLLKSAVPAERNSPPMQYLLGVRALSQRNYAAAIESLRRAEELPGRRQEAFRYRIYALCMSGKIDLAQRLAQERLSELFNESSAQRTSFKLPPFWLWMKKTFGLDPRAAGARRRGAGSRSRRRGAWRPRSRSRPRAAGSLSRRAPGPSPRSRRGA